MNQFGYSNAGLSARKLLQRAGAIKEIDAVGFNCGVGPSHMYRILQTLYKPADKFLTALPNAGYPQMVTGRMIFTGDNREYFVDRMQHRNISQILRESWTLPSIRRHRKRQNRRKNRLAQRITLFTITRKQKAGRN